MGWRYEWIATLPQTVYELLIELLNEEAQRVTDADYREV